jgi:hypothetical protein
LADRAALQLYEPIFEPKKFGENLWIVDGPCISMRYGVFRLPFTTRMTMIRLTDGLWVHSRILRDGKQVSYRAKGGSPQWRSSRLWTSCRRI